MEHLVFLLVAFFLVILTYPFHLSYLGLGVLAGLSIIVFAFMRGKEEFFEPPLGYFLVTLGLACLAIAFYISNSYGITFEALDHDKTLPKVVRRLPYFGVALFTIGAVIVIKSFFRKR